MVRSGAHGAYVSVCLCVCVCVCLCVCVCVCLCDCCLFFGEALLAMQVGGARLGKAAVQIGSKSTGLRSV